MDRKHISGWQRWIGNTFLDRRSGKDTDFFMAEVDRKQISGWQR